MNDDLIKSAVAFLNDHNVSSSPLTKKIEFLESKGLNQTEIEEALKRVNEASDSSVASSNSTSTIHNQSNNNTSYPSQPPIDYYNTAPPLPERSWKDYFIMATATAGVSYGLYQVINKYLIPAIIPPSQETIESDIEYIGHEFEKIDKVLEQLTKDQEQIKTDNEAKLKDIDTVIDNVNDFLTKYNKDKLKFDDDLKLMKLEVDNLNNSVEKNMKLNKENIQDELSDINEELQSLKELIKSRSAVSNGASNGTAVERKLVSASSIPSASEILKRAKEKANSPKVESSTPVTAATTSPTIPSVAPVSAPVPAVTPPPVPAASYQSPVNNTRSGGVTYGGVSAAGIPAWQLQHKAAEEQEEQPPSSSSTSIKDEEPIVAPTEEQIQQKIANVGIPAWQLSSNPTPTEGSSATAAVSGIPAWQLNNAQQS
ncbi:peroxisomal membrane protein PER10 [Scheffersomyces coipomensis]|uniref:peroxisomal membrane protein PER10 n=1 Tax=Scheffersomyces coipomensis TaxID=1788519 RepID=UPI00315D1FFC